MKIISLVIILFLNLFPKMASTQWSDDALLLRNSELGVAPTKKKDNKIRTSVVPIKERTPSQVVTRPEPVEANIENLEKEYTKSNIDLFVGFRKMDQVSQLVYKNFSGETPTIGAKASLIFRDWIWFLFYDTGFYYQTTKDSNLKLRDENVQFGFMKHFQDLPFSLSYGISYNENQIVNENQNFAFVGNKKSGFILTLQKSYLIDSSIAIALGVAIYPFSVYKEIGNYSSNQTRNSTTVMTNSVQCELVKKIDNNDSLLFNTSYNWTQVQFKELTSSSDSILEKPWNLQIGYRWGN